MRLTHPLPHTIGKLRKVLGKYYRLEHITTEGLAVTLPAGSRENIITLLAQTLSTAERQACKVLLLSEGEPPQLRQTFSSPAT